MENDGEEKQSMNNKTIYFKLDYPGQNLKENRIFIDFKKKIKQRGKDGKIYYCKKDKLYFCVIKENTEINPKYYSYYQTCPLCNNYICYYCRRIISPSMRNKGNCCVQLKLDNYFCLGTQDSIKKIILSNPTYFIPLFSFFLFYFISVNLLFFRLILKETKSSNDKLYYSYLNNHHGFLIRVIFLLIGFLLTICYTIFDIYFKIIILIISIFTQLYPLKYYIGFMIYGLDSSLRGV